MESVSEGGRERERGRESEGGEGRQSGVGRAVKKHRQDRLLYQE